MSFNKGTLLTRNSEKKCLHGDGNFIIECAEDVALIRKNKLFGHSRQRVKDVRAKSMYFKDSNICNMYIPSLFIGWISKK